MIPKTDSPSASDVGADLFAVEVVTKARGQDVNERFFFGAQSLLNEAQIQLSIQFFV